MGLSGVTTTASQETAVSPDERRQITVMFCDLVGSVALSQRLEDEVYCNLMQAYIGACEKVVRQYDGHVAEVRGDGLVAYFGWPRAHEDDAERSVLTALGTVQAVKAVSTAEPLAVHTGIATGPVVIVGGRAVGEPVILAARLSDMAKANEVWIAHDTSCLVGDTFELTDLGALPVEGMDRPRRAWRVDALRRTEGRFEAARKGLPLTPLVGREEDVASCCALGATRARVKDASC